MTELRNELSRRDARYKEEMKSYKEEIRSYKDALVDMQRKIEEFRAP